MGGPAAAGRPQQLAGLIASRFRDVKGAERRFCIRPDSNFRTPGTGVKYSLPP
jgi:hypothetical protein